MRDLRALRSLSQSRGMLQVAFVDIAPRCPTSSLGSLSPLRRIKYAVPKRFPVLGGAFTVWEQAKSPSLLLRGWEKAIGFFQGHGQGPAERRTTVASDLLTLVPYLQASFRPEVLAVRTSTHFETDAEPLCRALFCSVRAPQINRSIW